MQTAVPPCRAIRRALRQRASGGEADVEGTWRAPRRAHVRTHTCRAPITSAAATQPLSIMSSSFLLGSITWARRTATLRALAMGVSHQDAFGNALRSARVRQDAYIYILGVLPDPSTPKCIPKGILVENPQLSGL